MIILIPVYIFLLNANVTASVLVLHSLGTCYWWITIIVNRYKYDMMMIQIFLTKTFSKNLFHFTSNEEWFAASLSSK